jgi:integral membrane sensor domain MASE1
MTSQPYLVQPSRIAVGLVNLFTPAKDAELILGDLHEEFSQLASTSGVAGARGWYWRQALKTIAHLVCSAFRSAPWSTTAAVVGGFLLRRLIAGVPEHTIFAVLERYRVYDHHFRVYAFFASTGIGIGHVFAFLFVGCVVALAARGREMVASATLGLIYGAMIGVALLVWMTERPGHEYFLWTLPWSLADSFAIVVGGAIVRIRRSPAKTRLSGA